MLVTGQELKENQRQLQWFAQAAWGACWGILLAAALTPMIAKRWNNVVHPEVVLYGTEVRSLTVDPVERMEHFRVLGIYLLAPLGALAVFCLPVRLSLGMLLLSNLLQFPLLTQVICAPRSRERVIWLILSVLALLLPLLLRKQRGTATLPTLEDTQTPRPGFVPKLFGLAAVVGLCAALILPISLEELSDVLAREIHLGSFIFGPTLYYQHPGLIPGLDFESHYGIGPAYLFSFFAEEGVLETVRRYLWFFVVVVSFYFATGFLVLSSFFRSHRAGFACVLLLLFFTLEGNQFIWPSNWPIRFPFLFIFLWLAAKEALWGKTWPAVVATGCCAALSLFWQTDVGLYVTAAGAASYGARCLWGRQSWLSVPIFLSSSAVSFFLLSFLLFGVRVLSPEFPKRLLEPLALYSGGFGGVGMAWTHGWRYLYNLAGFIFGCATLGWALWQFKSYRGRSLPAAARFLFPCAAIGLLMIYKWVNRSIDTVWSYNAAAILIVLAFWLRQGIFALEEWLCACTASQRPFSLGSKVTVRGLSVVVILGAFVVAGVLDNPTPEPASPLARFSKYYHNLPTFANAWRTRQDYNPKDLPMHPEDTDFLRTHTKRNERVALLAQFDWLYLMETGRAPYFHYLHVPYTHSRVLLERISAELDRTDTVFIDRRFLSWLVTFNPAVEAEVGPRLRADFEPMHSAHNLVLVRRKTPAAAYTLHDKH